MHEIIKLKNVHFNYEETPILKDISLSIFPGEFIHIIGPNGGGKTTLLKLMMGLMEPTKGSVQVCGKAPIKMSSQMAYVPQSFSFDKLFPVSVFEVVLMARLSRLSWHGMYTKKDKDAALKALEQVHLIDLKDRPISALSGGQMQRVWIARALAGESKILFLDEPTSCLDHSSQIEIDKILKSLKGKLTLIMVTHDLDHIGKGCDRVFCIHGHLSPLNPNDVCQHISLGLYQSINSPVHVGVSQ